MQVFILGAGVTGLATGYVSGLPVFEAAAVPGGICSSYYMRPGSTRRLYQAPDDDEVYRFEVGGGHWIFGGDPAVLRFIDRLTPLKAYRRQSGVYFFDEALRVPYPVQYHLSYLGEEVAAQALREMSTPAEDAPDTMDRWLAARFGPTLTARFFGPFHECYTAGLWTRIAPQDPYKSPVDVEIARRGASGTSVAAGYNTRFVYPRAGLDALAQAMARQSDVRYDKRAVRIDPERKVVVFADGETRAYDVLISTLPLNKMMEMTGLEVESPHDPYTSVLVLNVGAVRGTACPDDHWLYVPDSEAGFFRIGCYSNVEEAFLPQSARVQRDRVSFYVERAFPGAEQPSSDEIDAYAGTVIEELRARGFIEEAEVVDPTWIDVAYTWSWPGSTWRTRTLKTLEAQDILMVGRYGRWIFQGIADSIRDGFMMGAAFKDVF
ncbi:MAG: protoporphyrinogen/coproporphyrinogen oxidase [Rhodothermales bacterium]